MDLVNCRQCGQVVPESSALSIDDRRACSNCGSLTRHFNAEISARDGTSVSIEGLTPAMRLVATPGSRGVKGGASALLVYFVELRWDAATEPGASTTLTVTIDGKPTTMALQHGDCFGLLMDLRRGPGVALGLPPMDEFDD